MPTFFKHKKQLILTPEKITLRAPCSSPFACLNTKKYGIKTTPKSAQLEFDLLDFNQFKRLTPDKQTAMLTAIEGKLENFRKALCFLNKEHEGTITLADTEAFYTKVKSYILNLGFRVKGLQPHCISHISSALRNG